jgi:hypothetical protein
MPGRPKVLDTDFVFKEWYYVGLRLVLPLIIFSVSVYFLIRQDVFSLKVFFINLSVALLVAIYLIFFLIKRMIFKFKEAKILKNEKEIILAQSVKQLSIGFLIFLIIVLLLFGTAIFYGTENGPFRWVLDGLDVGIILAVLWSIRHKAT